MSLENTIGNIVRGMAVASSLYITGCGTTIHTPIQTPTGEVWYDCNTNEDYPQRHPCYAQVKAYKARMAAASSSSTSSNDSVDRSDRSWSREPREKPSTGHTVCKRK